MASTQLRTLIDNVLQDTSRDMREQCDAVDVAFSKRVDEMQDAQAKMEENLKKVGLIIHVSTVRFVNEDDFFTMKINFMLT